MLYADKCLHSHLQRNASSPTLEWTPVSQQHSWRELTTQSPPTPLSRPPSTSTSPPACPPSVALPGQTLPPCPQTDSGVTARTTAHREPVQTIDRRREQMLMKRPQETILRTGHRDRVQMRGLSVLLRTIDHRDVVQMRGRLGQLTMAGRKEAVQRANRRGLVQKGHQGRRHDRRQGRVWRRSGNRWRPLTTDISHVSQRSPTLWTKLTRYGSSNYRNNRYVFTSCWNHFTRP